MEHGNVQFLREAGEPRRQQRVEAPAGVGLLFRPVDAGIGRRIDEGDRPIRRQPGRAPLDGHLLPLLELLQAVGRQHLDKLRRTDECLDRVAVGADLDAVAVGRLFGQIVRGELAVVDGGRAGQEVEVVAYNVGKQWVAGNTVLIESQLVEPIDAVGEIAYASFDVARSARR